MLSLLLGLLGLCFCAVDYTPNANGGLRNVIYYGDWSIWGGQDNFYPSLIPGDQLTHLNFAFLDFDANGELMYTDSGAAHDSPVGHTGVSWGDANAGEIPAFQDLRATYPNLRIGVSLGGWSKSGDFTAVCKNAATRAKFVDQVSKFVEYNNFDFIDVDWEYPGSVRAPDLCDNKNDEGTPSAVPEDGKYFVQLLQDLKAKENELEKKYNRVYELTVALPATSGNLEWGSQAYLPAGVTKDTATPEQTQVASSEYIQDIFSVIDFGNLMTYDMRGAWDVVSGHHTPLYSHPSGNPVTDEEDFSADGLVSYLLGKDTDSKGNPLRATIAKGIVPPQKLIIGVAFYSRGWAKVTNDGPEPVKYPGLFGTANVVGVDADQTPTPGATNAVPITQGDAGRLGGVWPYGKLNTAKTTFSGVKYYYDDIAEAPYFYADNGAFLSYDSPKSIAAKTEYVKQNGLGGIITWMTSMDATTGNEEGGSYSAGATRNVLTKAIKNGLWGTTPLEQFNIGAPSLSVTASVAIGTDWLGVAAYKLTLTNNFKNTETNDVLNRCANAAGSVASPRLYITVRAGITIGNGTSYGSGTWTQTGDLVTVVFSDTELKNLTPGQTFTLSVTSTAASLNVADIVKIEISKQIYSDGKEVGRAVVYQA